MNNLLLATVASSIKGGTRESGPVTIDLQSFKLTGCDTVVAMAATITANYPEYARFEWEQLDDTEPVVFVTDQSGVGIPGGDLLTFWSYASTVREDKVFRLWINRGLFWEDFADITISAVPSEYLNGFLPQDTLDVSYVDFSANSVSGDPTSLVVPDTGLLGSIRPCGSAYIYVSGVNTPIGIIRPVVTDGTFLYHDVYRVDHTGAILVYSGVDQAILVDATVEWLSCTIVSFYNIPSKGVESYIRNFGTAGLFENSLVFGKECVSTNNIPEVADISYIETTNNFIELKELPYTPSSSYTAPTNISEVSDIAYVETTYNFMNLFDFPLLSSSYEASTNISEVLDVAYVEVTNQTFGIGSIG